ncbi:hypothetical protein FHW16_003808 [Phyllobacterium myrsinacearum]|uniref:Uncharacterized protein n=1 Tax=Phyllobacterium myrsinacearum TaxID=28101 RepID=A0A839EMN3_9HYPH|nr:hypothetical protein [Phyllobacterium myrsinacearum]
MGTAEQISVVPICFMRGRTAASLAINLGRTLINLVEMVSYHFNQIYECTT